MGTRKTAKKGKVAKAAKVANVDEPPKRKRGRPRKNPQTAKVKNTMGRPRLDVDWSEVDKLCKLHCTAEEICGHTGISEDTYLRRCKEDFGLTFAEYIRKKTCGGNVSLRRKQWRLAQLGHPTMLIWLGKQWLGQTDKVETKGEHSVNYAPIILPDNGRDPTPTEGAPDDGSH